MDASAQIDIAISHHQAGRLAQAKTLYLQILQESSQDADALHLLGLVFHQLGEHQAAIDYIQRATAIKPNAATFLANLGAVYLAAGDLPNAVTSCQRAVHLNPGDSKAYFNLGCAYQALGKLDEAVGNYKSAIQIKPDYAEAQYNLGTTLNSQSKLSEAVTCYERALELKPDYAEACNNLGNTLKNQGKPADVIACYARALELKPDSAEAINNLGGGAKDQGRIDDALACYERALQLKPDFVQTHDNLLYTLNYRGGVTLRELAEAHAEYEQQHAAPLRTRWKPYENIRSRDRPLRLGFVSPDLGQHPVGFFLIRVLENVDGRAAEIICYSNRTTRDGLTARFQTTANTWYDVAGWSDERLAEQIRADRIDILFDLAGHTAKSCLLVFARKPAPIQISWGGYPGTTGLTAMDYILADRQHIPAVAESYDCEKVLRMPDGYVCYDPPAYAPPVSSLPAKEEGRVTFGSFNNPAKINAQVIEVWAKILARVPQSRLVLKYKGMSDSQVASRFGELFASHGIDQARVAFLDKSPHAKLLGEYRQIDMALDPFPYSGGLTTCEALWMGVPVITCPHETFASRHSLSHLPNVGLTDTIARDLSDYVELAVGLANDLPRLTKLRAELRERMESSPLCDGPRFAGNLMKSLRTVWREWCQTSDSEVSCLGGGPQAQPPEA